MRIATATLMFFSWLKKLIQWCNFKAFIVQIGGKSVKGGEVGGGLLKLHI